jgi:hypothetical protein
MFDNGIWNMDGKINLMHKKYLHTFGKEYPNVMKEFLQHCGLHRNNVTEQEDILKNMKKTILFVKEMFPASSSSSPTTKTTKLTKSNKPTKPTTKPKVKNASIVS